MTRFPVACAVLALSLASPMFAQDNKPSDQTPMPSPPASSTQTPMQQQQMTSPSSGSTTAADLTGQAIYSSKGRKIGTVSSMSTDANGQQAAAVRMGKYLGMGGQTLNIPVSSLQARSGGGYTTTLSSTELKALAKSGSGSMQ